MNTHDIELPPLPSPLGIVNPDGTEGMMHYTTSDLQDYAKAYAQAAIEADRKRRGEPVAWMAEHQSGEWHVRATPTIPSTGIYTGRIKPLYEAPQPAEPVVVAHGENRVNIGLEAKTGSDLGGVVDQGGAEPDTGETMTRHIRLNGKWVPCRILKSGARMITARRDD